MKSFFLPIVLVLIGIGFLVVSMNRNSGVRREGVPVFAELPDFSLIDQTGTAFGLNQLLDKVWIANFIFTRCPATCPLQTVHMARLQEQLSRDPLWEDIRLVSFTVDPEFDTPGVLQEYARQAEADDGHWKFLTGTRDAIWELSMKGFKIPVGENPPSSNQPLFHSPKLALVDRQGRIRGFYDGLSQAGLNELKQDLKPVLGEDTPRVSEVRGQR